MMEPNVPRPTKNVVIEGQFASGVLGTFRSVRGFATLQELALISTPYPMTTPLAGTAVQGHQRAIDPDHANAIKRYLQNGQLRFIPEVILSVRANFRDELDDQQRIIGIVSDDTPGLTVKRRFKSKNIATHQIIVDRERLPVLIEQEKRIRRIDGNHRLHLARELQAEATSPTKYLAPFCAILLAPPGDPNDDYVESMLFHTINSTALPLDSEHALQLVLGQQAGYRPTADEEFASSAPLHLTRLLKARMDAMPDAQQERLGPTPATVLHAAAQAMTASDPALTQSRQAMESFASGFSGGLTDVLAHLIAVHPGFCKADFFLELAALAWKDTRTDAGHDERVAQAVQTLDAMGRWLGRDGLDKVQTKRSLAQQLFEVFRAVRNRIPKRVFLSRWYPADADGEELRKAKLRKQMIDRTLEDLRGEGIELALDDPGTQTGGTFPIHRKLYEAIANNDIILLDLSGVRPNVLIEAGYALERHKRNRLLFLFQPTQATQNNLAFAAPPFDLTTFRYEPVADAAEIPDKLKPHLRAIWQEAMTGNA